MQADQGYINEIFSGTCEINSGTCDAGAMDSDGDESDFLDYYSYRIEEVNTACTVDGDLTYIEETLTHLAVRNGSGLDCDMRVAINALEIYSTVDEEYFQSVKVITKINEISIMSTNQYEIVCHTFGCKKAIATRLKREIKGIGGRNISVETVMLQGPFKYRLVVIDVTLMLLQSPVPSRLCPETYTETV